MIEMSDVPLDDFVPLFARMHVPVAFLVPTPTGHKKSIMDATYPVRDFLKRAGIHDYEVQKQGQENKVRVKSHFVGISGLTESVASLYRPCTKEGDPRIWFDGLKKYCMPANLLAIIAIKGELYVFNLSNGLISDALFRGGFTYEVLQEAAHVENEVAEELLGKLKRIHRQGFLPSITPGDPGVGDTLENALGIKRNCSTKPDYKGIELKATRMTKQGKKRQTTRVTLFTKTPELGLTYAEIIQTYGKIQIPRGSATPRLQLYDTLRYSRPNAYDLLLKLDNEDERLSIYHEVTGNRDKWVSAWLMKTLKDVLLQKHSATFWIQAASIRDDCGLESFRYDKVIYTRKPNVSLIAPLIQQDIITADLAGHKVSDNRYRDHGLLFKIEPDKRQLLFGESEEYDLSM